MALFGSILYDIILLFATTLGLIHLKTMDKASKLIVLLITITTVIEISALIAKYVYEYNLILYNLFSPIQLIITILYFIHSLNSIGQKKVGNYIVYLSISIWIVNAIFFQNIFKVLNTYFIFYESICIVGLALLFFYRLLSSDKVESTINAHFLFSSILMLFWSVTFLYWILYLSLYEIIPKDKNSWLNIFLKVISMITYLSFGLVFLFYKRLQPARE